MPLTFSFLGRYDRIRRQMLVSGALALATGLIMIAGLSARAEMEQYEPDVILSLPWGNGPNEIGYAKDGPEDQEGLRWGPSAIALDRNGNIYILESVNRRVKVFDQTGKLLKNFPIKRTPSDIYVDIHGNIWGLDGADPKIYKYTPDGTHIETICYQLNKDIRGGLRKIDVQDGKIYALGFYDYASEFEVKHVKIIGKGEEGEDVKSATLERIDRFLPRSRNYYRIEKISDQISKFVISDRSSRVLASIEFTRIYPYEGIDFLSEDKSGNVYLIILCSIEKGDYRLHFYSEIWKCTPSGKLVAKIGPIFRTFYTHAEGQWLVVDDIGNVYQLTTEKEGVKVIKWSKS